VAPEEDGLSAQNDACLNNCEGISDSSRYLSCTQRCVDIHQAKRAALDRKIDALFQKQERLVRQKYRLEQQDNRKEDPR